MPARPQKQEGRPSRVGSRIATFSALTLVAGVWMGVFLTFGKGFSPAPYPNASHESMEVQEHFVALAGQQRKGVGFEPYFIDGPEAGRVRALLEFTQEQAVPIRTPAIDGFLTRYVNIFRDGGGVVEVSGYFSRPAPYVWPRTLDVALGAGAFVRADLDEKVSTEEKAVYRIASRLPLEMKSPNGHFYWTTSKDDTVLNAPECLFRQDLYKDGEYFKSLAAVSAAGTASNPKIP